MATATEAPRRTKEAEPTKARMIASQMVHPQILIALENALSQCDPELHEVIEEMLEVYLDPSTTQDEKLRASATIVDAVFPALAQGSF